MNGFYFLKDKNYFFLLKTNSLLLPIFEKVMKIITFASIVFFLFTNCITPLGIKQEIYQGYKPVEPLPSKIIEYYDVAYNDFIKKPWASISDSLKRILLPNQSAQVAMRKIESNGNIKYQVASVTNERGSYEVIMDYMKYKIEDVIADSVKLGSGRIGIGLRVKASIITNKSSLNLSGLTSLGLEASKNNLSGYLSVDIIGIDSKDITNYIPITAKLDETSIQNALQAVSTIKSKIWDENVSLTPHLIAINQAEENSEVIIIERITSVGEYYFSKSSDIIKRYWKPDGKTINNNNENTLVSWMITNNLDTNAGGITNFIYVKNMESMREKAVIELNLK